MGWTLRRVARPMVFGVCAVLLAVGGVACGDDGDSAGGGGGDGGLSTPDGCPLSASAVEEAVEGFTVDKVVEDGDDTIDSCRYEGSVGGGEVTSGVTTPTRYAQIRLGTYADEAKGEEAFAEVSESGSSAESVAGGAAEITGSESGGPAAALVDAGVEAYVYLGQAVGKTSDGDYLVAWYSEDEQATNGNIEATSLLAAMVEG